MDRVAVGEIEICYDRRGRPEDPLVVLVSGLSRPLVSWDDGFVDLLVDEGFSVLRFDNRDAGRSTSFDGAPPFDFAAALRGDRTVVTYTLDDMADDVAGLLEVLGLGPAHFVGVSMGGMIAQMVAARHRHLVRSLCSIMSTTGARDVGHPTPEAHATLFKSAPTERDAYIEYQLATQLVIGSPPPLADPDYRRALFGRAFDHGVNPRGTGRQLMAIVASGDRTAAVSTIEAPTLVIHGERDALVAMSGGVATAAAIAGATTLFIPGMGHDLPPALWPQIVGAIVANAARAQDVPARSTS
ncbi:MAG: alpha/beta fold hydrolase [Acidimicrobiales bacterium]